MGSLAKRTHLPIEHGLASLANRFPLACWASYGVLGKAFSTCLLDTVWRPWQSAPKCLLNSVWRPWQSVVHLPIGQRMASLAKRFPLAYWTSYGVLGKSLPTCLLDIVWRPLQSASHLPVGDRMTTYLNSDFSCILVLSKVLKMSAPGDINLSLQRTRLEGHVRHRELRMLRQGNRLTQKCQRR